MSNYLSIATVTEAFRQILDEAAAASGVAGASATAVRPTSGTNNGQPGNPPVAGVNLYLYQVLPNAYFRNADEPVRRADGSLIQPTRSAYDLNYLLTFYGSETNLEPQRVMGNVLRVLNSLPILTRKRVESVKMSFPFLAASNLETEAETVKVGVLPLNLEELSKLWSVFFQAIYSPSIAFQASVVFLDGTEVPGPALPVRSRNVYVRPFRQPVIEQNSFAKTVRGKSCARSAHRRRRHARFGGPAIKRRRHEYPNRKPRNITAGSLRYPDQIPSRDAALPGQNPACGRAGSAGRSLSADGNAGKRPCRERVRTSLRSYCVRPSRLPWLRFRTTWSTA